MPLQLPLNDNELLSTLGESPFQDKLVYFYDATKDILIKIKTILKTISTPCYNVLQMVNRRLSRVFVLKIPVIYLLNIFAFVLLLLKFIPHYSRLYATLGLPATLISNLLLFGLADSLAQTLTRILTRRPSHHIIVHQYDELASPSISSTASQIPYSDDNHSERFQIFVDYGDEDDYHEDTSPASGIRRDFEQSDNHSITSIASNSDAYRGMNTTNQNFEIFDYHRLAGFMVWGFFISFPQFFWYMILNGLYVDDPKFITVLERVLADQLFYSPLSLAGFFYYSNTILEGGDKASFKKKMKKIYISTLAANYCLWPAVQFINFLVLPKPYQVPFSSSVGVLWNCFLSIRNAQSQE
ncbi:hypothetical protein DASC09_000850 [Saccharomycopsis crataegensis]|uniref:Uncharacterized protein n=1 Tax=Saccharomycopsis crataegensis TaxID=43959 RepID=A0AAV5QE83_9ASCO|nr:hypothetical protein DASC09_000850 [Saccharomycopsis crataegensis]